MDSTLVDVESFSRSHEVIRRPNTMVISRGGGRSFDRGTNTD